MNFEENADIILDATRNYLIYFLLHKNEVVYVGQTTQNLLRPFAHKDKTFDSIAIIYQTEDKKELDKIEQFYIKKYTPKYNKVFNPDGYSNNVVNAYYEIEKIKHESGYYINIKQLNAMLIKNGFYTLSKKEYKHLKNFDFNFQKKCVFMDPLSFLRLMKLLVYPDILKNKRMPFNIAIKEILSMY